eukprot:scaffold310904_cov13-Tisochrysis_lutea.AAC.1
MPQQGCRVFGFTEALRWCDSIQLLIQKTLVAFPFPAPIAAKFSACSANALACSAGSSGLNSDQHSSKAQIHTKRWSSL